MDLTKRIAEYTRDTTLEDFPLEAITAAKSAITDCLGCALAGSREPLADLICGFIRSNGAAPVASVMAKGFKSSAPDAALANGAMAHALDYDDITQGIKGHPSIVLLPSSMAVAEAEGATGRDLLLSYVLGFEVACSVGDGMSVAYGDDLGWHPTGPLGTIGAAVAAARILNLDHEQVAMAVSLAASQASGLRQNFGTMTKPLHAGLACRAGVTAAMLVKSGFTASRDALEGRFGFIHAFSGGRDYDIDIAAQGLGKNSHLIESGIEIKKYPCCGSAQLALDAAFRLMDRERIEADEVDRVKAKVDFDPPRSLIHSRPRTALEGKFSMQYCLAAALLDRQVGLSTFTDEQVMRREAQALIPKIDMRRIQGYEGKKSWTEGYNEVEVHLVNGRVLQQKAERPIHGALRGATTEDVETKFKDCSSPVLSAAESEEVLGLLNGLDNLGDLERLTDLLRRNASENTG